MSTMYPMLDAPAPPAVASAPPLVADDVHVAERPAACGQCDRLVAPGEGAFVVLACAHYMHVACFLRKFGKLSEPDARSLGGHTLCIQCVRKVQTTTSFTNVIDRDAVLKTLHAKFVHATGRSLDVSPDEVFSEKKIDAFLCRTSGFFTSFKDYTEIREMSEPELLALMKKNDASFTRIFQSQSLGLTLKDLHDFGIRTFASLRELGFHIAHLDVAWSAVSPLWLLNSLYDVTSRQLLDLYTADGLLNARIRSEELWLTGLTMRELIAKGLSKAALLKYPVPPTMLVKYLALEGAHLVQLGVRRSELDKLERWRKHADDELVAPLLVALS